jgi:hypothetical protein
MPYTTNNRVLAIRTDLPDMDRILKSLEGPEALTYTREAVKTSTEVVQRRWIDYISGATVSYSGGTFVVHSVSGQYMRSIIDGLKYPALGDPLTGEVGTTVPYASNIEDGVRPYDMKQTHLNGPKVKTAKDGSRYITVPFRHGTPGAVTMKPMPESVYQHAKNLAVSRRNGMLKTWWTGKKYTWGDRLESQYGGRREKPHWSTGRYTGMVKMAGFPHSQYLTFRRLSEKSDPRAWLHPGMEKRPVTQAVVENSRDEIIDLIRTGFEVDLAKLGL